MRIYSKERFEENYKRIIANSKDAVSFKKGVCKAVFLLQTNKDLSRQFTVNRLGALGEGFYDCYVYSDIVMIYRIIGRSAWLINIGTAKDLLDRE